jgi:hypothetical protein
MLDIRVKIDERSLKEADRILRAIPRAVPRVFRRAFKRTVDKAVTDFKDRIVRVVNQKKGAIGRALKKRWSSDYGSISAQYGRPGLMEYKGTSQSARGVRYRIVRGGKRGLIEHGFIARMQSGHRGVFKRERGTRLPVQEKRGLSVWQVIIGTAGLLRAAIDKAGNLMGKFINDQIGVEFRRWSK